MYIYHFCYKKIFFVRKLLLEFIFSVNRRGVIIKPKTSKSKVIAWL